MSLWNTREQSLHWLENELAAEAEAIQHGFSLIDECIAAFDQAGKTEGATLRGRFARICGLTTTKARNLILGCFSLTLDALAQESGALLRPLIETYEQLIYFHNEPERVDEAIEERLPSAGRIARAISGQFQSLREHLNQHASHFGFKYDSVRHLLNIQDATLMPVQTHSQEVFRTNLNLINAFEVFIVVEAITCLGAVGMDANDLAHRAEAWKNHSIRVFQASESLPNAGDA